MPVVADFVRIVGDSWVTIGDADDSWEVEFNTANRRSDQSAFLLFNIKGLTATTQSAHVYLNGVDVGQIYPYSGGDAARNNWYAQLITFQGSALNSGSNKIGICAVPSSSPGGGDRFDDFALKDMFCFFHQDS